MLAKEIVEQLVELSENVSWSSFELPKHTCKRRSLSYPAEGNAISKLTFPDTWGVPIPIHKLVSAKGTAKSHWPWGP